MSALPSLASVLPPLHLLSYSTLLGSSLYQTFVNTKVCYTSLSPSAFRTLNKSIFPVYFRTQNALVLFTAVTLPRWSQGDATLMGFLGVMAGLNLLRYGPATERCMVERVWQGEWSNSLPYPWSPILHSIPSVQSNYKAAINPKCGENVRLL
jgi:hypothetical protein